MAADRADIVRRADPVVVKVGTNVLADPAGALDRGRIQALADQLARVRAGGRRVALVSSGAIGAGVGRAGLGRPPTHLPHLPAGAPPRPSAPLPTGPEGPTPPAAPPPPIPLP